LARICDRSAKTTEGSFPFFLFCISFPFFFLFCQQAMKAASDFR